MATFNTGDKLTLIHFNTISASAAALNNSVGNISIKIFSEAEITRAGEKQITLQSKNRNINVKICDIGKPIEGFFKGRYFMVVPKDASVDEYVSKAKDFIRNSLRRSNKALMKALDTVNAELDREHNWFVEDD